MRSAPWRVFESSLRCSGAPQHRLEGLGEFVDVLKSSMTNQEGHKTTKHCILRCLEASASPELEFWRPRSHDPRYIHRSQRLQEVSWRSPSHDLSALSTFQSLRSHDLSALPSDYERREAFERAAKSRSIGPVGVWRQRPLQNSSSGGVGAAILETFITLEASQGTTTPSEPSATHLIVGGLGPPKTT